MTEATRLAQNAAMLAQCHPVARDRFKAVIADMELDGFFPRIQEAWRAAEEQAAAHASDHSDVSWSLHMAETPSGKPDALAIDLLDNMAPNPANPGRLYLLRLAFHARKHSCRTGILWHLKGADRVNLDAAINQGATSWPGKIGFDPCHVEVADVTYGDAFHGARPNPVVSS